MSSTYCSTETDRIAKLESLRSKINEKQASLEEHRAKTTGTKRQVFPLIFLGTD
jgi:hypothetical protein